MASLSRALCSESVRGNVRHDRRSFLIRLITITLSLSILWFFFLVFGESWLVSGQLKKESLIVYVVYVYLLRQISCIASLSFYLSPRPSFSRLIGIGGEEIDPWWWPGRQIFLSLLGRSLNALEVRLGVLRWFAYAGQMALILT